MVVIEIGFAHNRERIIHIDRWEKGFPRFRLDYPIGPKIEKTVILPDFIDGFRVAMDIQKKYGYLIRLSDFTFEYAELAPILWHKELREQANRPEGKGMYGSNKDALSTNNKH